MSKSKSKPKSKSKSLYRLKNWSEYDASLKQRGSLTFWLTPEVVQEWLNHTKTGGRGASSNYSDTAIEFMVTIQSMFCLAGHQRSGFVESIFQLMGLDLPATFPQHCISSITKIESKFLENLITGDPCSLDISKIKIKV